MNRYRAWSMRRRLLAWLLTVLLVVCALLLVEAYASARAAADRAYDRLLQASALAIAERVIVLDDRVDVDLPYAALQMLASVAQDRVFYRITGPRGEYVTGYADLPPPVRGLGKDLKPRFYDASYRGEPVRIALLNKSVAGGRVAVAVAQTRGERRSLAQELALNTAWRLLLLIAAAGVILGAGIRHVLLPLNMLRGELRHRSARDLYPLQTAVAVEVVPLVTAVNQLMARLQRSLGVMQQFIADAAHQLRTPLAALQTQTELALREQDITGLKAALRQLHDTTRRTSRLANQLLDHARASADTGMLNFITLDLTELAAALTRERVPLVLKRDIDLGFEAEAAVSVRGDALLLREMLKNLIDNAIRYCANGTRITVRVRVERPTTADNAAGACLEVEDDGPGIPPAERERVCDRFYRQPDSGGEGSGLGLAIVKEVVKVHGGLLKLGEGAGGKGLRVTVLLPLDSYNVHFR